MSYTDKDGENHILFPLSDKQRGSIKKALITKDAYELEEHAQDLIFRIAAQKDFNDRALLLVVANALIEAKGNGKIALDSFLILHVHPPFSDSTERLKQGCFASMDLIAKQEAPSAAVKHLLTHCSSQNPHIQLVCGQMFVKYLPLILDKTPRLVSRALPLAQFFLAPYQAYPEHKELANFSNKVGAKEAAVHFYEDYYYPEKSTKYSSPTRELAKKFEVQKPSSLKM